MEILTKEIPEEIKKAIIVIKPKKIEIENILYENMNKYFKIIEEIEEESESEEEAGKEQILNNINIPNKESSYKDQEKGKSEENNNLRKSKLFINSANEIFENKIEKKRGLFYFQWKVI